jgi:endonuclease VIII
MPNGIEHIEVKGKNIFIYLTGGEIIYNHMLMWGWWLPTIEPVSKKRLNTAFMFSDGSTLGYFGGGTIKVITKAEADKLKAGLGIDILDAATAEEAFAQVAKSELPIGQAVLEQGLISGIGNVYKSEGLFIGRVNPLRSANQVTPKEYERIFSFLQPQMRADIKRPGKMITTTKEAAKAGKWNFVYRRYHQACLMCNTKIERIYQGTRLVRSTYYCPNCQKT